MGREPSEGSGGSAAAFGPRFLLRFCSLLLVAVVAGASAASVRAKTGLVVATVPLNQRMEELLRAKLVEQVVCTLDCTFTSSLRIRPTVAHQLGFKGVKSGQWYQIGTNRLRLAAEKPARVPFTLTPQAKKLLPKARNGVQLVGLVSAVSVKNPSVTGGANWVFTCNWRHS